MIETCKLSLSSSSNEKIKGRAAKASQDRPMGLNTERSKGGSKESIGKVELCPFVRGNQGHGWNHRIPFLEFPQRE